MDKRDIYKAVLGMIDLTSLNSTDTYTKIAAMTEKVNRFHDVFPSYRYSSGVRVLFAQGMRTGILLPMTEPVMHLKFSLITSSTVS